MIQDLSDMAVLGGANPEPLQAIDFDMKKLDIAAETSTTMSDLLAKANGARMSGNMHKALRDKAYTFMKEAVDEIRLNGKYVFWRNEERKKRYVSRYLQYHITRTRKESKKKTEESAL
jgi:hypothetical protein